MYLDTNKKRKLKGDPRDKNGDWYLTRRYALKASSQLVPIKKDLEDKAKPLNREAKDLH